MRKDRIEGPFSVVADSVLYNIICNRIDTCPT